MSSTLSISRRPSATTEGGSVALPQVPAGRLERCTLIGEHATMREVYRLMARAAPTLVPVLLLGESGTGREAIARCIHDASPVAAGPWVAVQCASDKPEQLERELFGLEGESEQGSMTRELGGFEQASGGTIFLGDIADLTPALQARLLRAVQQGEIERIGSGEIIPVHTRIIASSTRDLRRAAADGRFREDLYFRLAIVTIHVPRLADRGDDLLLLVAGFVQHFLRRAKSSRTVTHLGADALHALTSHRWAGNVRELRSAIEHAVLATSGDTIELSDLPDDFNAAAGAVQDAGPAGRTGRTPSLAEMEARHIAFVLAETQGVIHVAAEVLGIHRNTLTRKIREYGL